MPIGVPTFKSNRSAPSRKFPRHLGGSYAARKLPTNWSRGVTSLPRAAALARPLVVAGRIPPPPAGAIPAAGILLAAGYLLTLLKPPQPEEATYEFKDGRYYSKGFHYMAPYANGSAVDGAFTVPYGDAGDTAKDNSRPPRAGEELEIYSIETPHPQWGFMRRWLPTTIIPGVGSGNVVLPQVKSPATSIPRSAVQEDALPAPIIGGRAGVLRGGYIRTKEREKPLVAPRPAARPVPVPANAPAIAIDITPTRTRPMVVPNARPAANVQEIKLKSRVAFSMVYRLKEQGSEMTEFLEFLLNILGLNFDLKRPLNPQDLYDIYKWVQVTGVGTNHSTITERLPPQFPTISEFIEAAVRQALTDEVFGAYFGATSAFGVDDFF